MADFNWDDYQAVQHPAAPQMATANSSFNWDDYDHAPPSDPLKSPVTAATTGLIQGAVPFAGTLAGVGKAVADTVSGVSGPLAGGDLGDIADSYRSGRDAFMQDASKAAANHPVISTVANIAGGGANPLFQAASSLPGLAAAGAVQATGSSQADLTKGDVLPVAEDAALGAGGGALGYAAGKVIPKAIDAAKYLGQKALTNFGPSSEAIAARFAGRAQDDARSFPQLAEDLAGSAQNLKNQVFQKSNDARSVLSQGTTLEEGGIPKEVLLNSVDEGLAKLGVDGKLVGGADKSASSELQSIRDDLNQLGPVVSENDAKTIIQRLDDNINWDDQSRNRTNSLMEGVRTGIDQSLKFKNPDYAEAMQPVSDRARTLAAVKRLFNLKDTPGGLEPQNATANSIQSSLKENKAVSQDTLDQLKDFTGQDYQDLANDYNLSKQFQTKSPQMSSKKTNIGAAVGAGLGYLLHGVGGAGLGTSAGALAGGAMDAYGGPVAAKIIDSLVSAGNSNLFGKFAPALEAARQRGPQALSATAAILMSNPEFQDAFQRATGPAPTPQ